MCFKDRKTPATIVMAMSALLIVLGFILVVMSVVFFNRDNILRADLGELTEYVKLFKVSIFGLIIFGALVTIITGIFGTMCRCKPCHHRCYIITWGTSLTFVWVLFIIVGAVIMGNALGAPKYIGEVCKGTYNE